MMLRLYKRGLHKIHSHEFAVLLFQSVNPLTASGEVQNQLASL